MTTDLMTVISMALNTLKTMKELGENEKYAEVMKGIAEMSIKLSEMTMSASELMNENNALMNEIKILKESKDKGLAMKDGAYYDKNNNGPYCPVCWDTESLS